ncbi:MAG: bacteriohemerythrin [Opitutales bacterium]
MAITLNTGLSMLTWNDKYNTGIAEIDDDHQKLVEALNQLETALKQGAGAKQVGQLLDFLAQYATIHFAREESCMHRLNCPNAAANKAAHAQFIKKFSTAKSRLTQSTGAGALVAIQINRELSEWISQHILTIDSGLKLCAHRQVVRN